MHWLKSGGGVDGGGGDRESCRPSEALLAAAAFLLNKCLQRMFSKCYSTKPAQMRFASFQLKAHLAVLPTAVPPRQVLQLQHAEDQGDG